MKTALIWILIIIVVAAGGFFAYTYYLNTAANTSGDQQTASGDDVVQAQEVTAGTGAEAVPGSIVSVLYVGRLADGTVFDSSAAHGNEPLVFQLGAPGIIAGFQIGVNGMREGGERLIAIPPSYGYGSEDVSDPDGNVIIPANSTLVFNVRLVSVEEAPAETTTTETSETE